MTNRPKAIGTATETAVVRYLQTNGFPHAERRALYGALDCGDVTGIPGVVVEIKGGKAAKTASDGQVTAWLAETEKERVNARADIGILVLQRASIGPTRAGLWWAVVPLDMLVPKYAARHVPTRLHLADVVTLLRREGHGDPMPDEVDLGAQYPVADDLSDVDPWDAA